MKDFYYYTNCVNSTAELINDMVEKAKEVKYETFARRCADLSRWARAMGYGPWLRLRSDCHVSYYRSTYDGKPCYYAVHSAIEYIWLRRK